MKVLPSNTIGALHENLVFDRRVKVLANWFARLAPPHAKVLDIGCGDGLISSVLQTLRPDLTVRGIDVLPRDLTHIPVEIFDGTTIPYADSAFDLALFSDVLHHTMDPNILLREAARVAGQGILLKDHYREGVAARARLRFMDWVGNARFGVALPYNYWTKKQWREAWQRLGLAPQEVVTELGLYPLPAKWIFEARLHFVAFLTKCD